MVTLEEYNKAILSLSANSDYEETNIECPKCGKPLHRYTKLVFASNPPKYRYECFECKWKGTGF